MNMNMNRNRSRRTVFRFVAVHVLLLVGGVLVAHSTESFQFDYSSSTSRRNTISINDARRSQPLPLPLPLPLRVECHRTNRHQSISTLLSAHYLTTALECLWEERIITSGDDNDSSAMSSSPSDSDDYRCLSWLDLDLDLGIADADHNGDGVSPATVYSSSSSSSNSSIAGEDQDQDDTTITLPLYPLNEVYLPSATTSSDVNHTLNNVEPQNIQMALDLLSEKSSSLSQPQFCVVLRATDTGRVATIGNILRIIDTEEQRTNDENGDNKIVRIRLTCRSEGLVEIVRIENGSGWKEKRLLRSNEYLRARVRPVVVGNDDDNDNGDDVGNSDVSQSWQDVYSAIREDLRMIKLIYQLQLGAEEFPPGTLLRLGNAIQDFPALDGDDLHSTSSSTSSSSSSSDLLWNLAQEWQSVCMTLRQGRQALLATERNERMVAAACAKGGPLKLPIHMSDLEPESRWEIQRLDQAAQEDHEESGMDPVLDFQVLIGLPTTKRRFEFLAKLVSRERRRLEDVASSLSSSSSSSSSVEK